MNLMGLSKVVATAHFLVVRYATTSIPVSEMNIQYKNRNPRNTEILAIAPKRKGWEFQKPRVDYWNKVQFEKTHFHTTGTVIHWSSAHVVSASTREPSIQKRLYSCVDVSAATNIGRILAYRCQQCGIQHLFFDEDETPLTSESTKAFYDALLEGGITLKEPDEVVPPAPLGINYDQLCPSEKRSLYPSLIENLRTTPDWDNIPYPYSLRPRAGTKKLKNWHQILSKVRRGMVWDPFYGRMVFEKDKSDWQHAMERRRAEQLGGSSDSTTDSESVPTLIPKKWRLT